MKRRILIALLALGTVAGFAAGISHLRCPGRHGWERRAHFEQHVADLCTEAALRAQKR
ncbi:MAG TPA: hypothetical protein VK524_11520 [Polyangiaceae bacterium]|nr:hypothetical protein [Polyangiaceae bacterium]